MNSKRIISRIGIVSAGLTVAMSSFAGLSASALSQTSSANDPSSYIAPLHPLNRSGVTGFANLSLNETQPGATLTASVNARGAEPSQIHAMHIHGKLDGANAECPAPSADTNNDRLVSVFEGAPFYGPIKVNFTDPPTTFGPPSRTDLFAPFAGVPVANNFPHSNVNGGFQYNQTIPFDVNNQYAVQALSSLTPLSDQHIVIHGGFAPESVDTPNGSPTTVVYDPLLPVACGQIIRTHQGSAGSQGQNNHGNSGSSSISNTGPGSTNTVHGNSSSTTDITNTNNVRSSNNSSQTSASGNVNSNHNTFGGAAASGNTSNSNSNSVFVRIWNKVF